MKKSNMDIKTIKTLGYLGIFILLIFIILPPLFRTFFPEEDQAIDEEKKLIMNLTCTKTEDFVEYKIITTINTNYVDSVINDSTFTYDIETSDSIFAPDNISIEEYENLKKLSNVDFEENKNKYILKIDYAKFDYSNEPLLSEHKKVIAEQMVTYTNDSFECKTARVQ